MISALPALYVMLVSLDMHFFFVDICFEVHILLVDIEPASIDETFEAKFSRETSID